MRTERATLGGLSFIWRAFPWLMWQCTHSPEYNAKTAYLPSIRVTPGIAQDIYGHLRRMAPVGCLAHAFSVVPSDFPPGEPRFGVRMSRA